MARIVCLANSLKTGGYCVAGREVHATGSYGGWFRPVSERSTAELWQTECEYGDKVAPKLLDLIEVPLLRPAPHNHQAENHVIAQSTWRKVGDLPRQELDKLREQPKSLWINSDSTREGIFDCISQPEASRLHNSLVLIKVRRFFLKIDSQNWTGQPKRTYRGLFNYNDTMYRLKITDPLFITSFASHQEAEYELENRYLCVSLTEPWKDNRCYKLIAAVL